MNPRQRHGVALLVASVIGAGGVFGAVASYTASVSRRVGPTRVVLTLVNDVPAYHRLTQADLVERSIPEMYTVDTELSDFDEIAGRVPAVRLKRGSRLQQDVLVAVPAASPREREITVSVGVEAGVAAALGPDDRVDIVAAYEAVGDKPPYAKITVPGARVLRVTRLAEAGSAPSATAATDALHGNSQLAVTFALQPKQVSAVVLAQTVAATLRLALLPRGILPKVTAPSPSAAPSTGATP